MNWKDIKDYEDLYQISDTGLIRHKDSKIKRKSKLGKVFYYNKKGKILSPGTTLNGYNFINLSKNNHIKHYDIHRLVAQAFIDNQNNYPEVNHKDGNKQNNCVDNLEWCDRGYNLKHALNLGLVNSQCKIRRKVWIKKGNEILEFTNMTECCSYFGFTKCWLGNYLRKNGNPCLYKGYEIKVGERYI